MVAAAARRVAEGRGEGVSSRSGGFDIDCIARCWCGEDDSDRFGGKELRSGAMCL